MREWEKMCAEWATRKKTKNNLFSASFLFWCFEWEPFRLLPALLFQKRTFFFLSRSHSPTINQFGVLFVGTGAVCVICWTICWNRAQGSRSDGGHFGWWSCTSFEWPVELPSGAKKMFFVGDFFFRLLLHWLSSELELWNVFLVRLRPPASWITELVTKHFIR